MHLLPNTLITTHKTPRFFVCLYHHHTTNHTSYHFYHSIFYCIRSVSVDQVCYLWQTNNKEKEENVSYCVPHTAPHLYAMYSISQNRNLKETSNFMTTDSCVHNSYKELQLKFVFNVDFNSAFCLQTLVSSELGSIPMHQFLKIQTFGFPPFQYIFFFVYIGMYVLCMYIIR